MSKRKMKKAPPVEPGKGKARAEQIFWLRLVLFSGPVIWYNNPQSCRLRGCACAPHTLLCWRTGL